MAVTRARIAIDAMGGDHAPAEIVAGALRAHEELDADVILVGDPEQISAELKKHTSDQPMEIVPADGVVEMEEEPIVALRRKPKASINVAMQLVKDKRQGTLGRRWQQPCCAWVGSRASNVPRSLLYSRL